MRAHCSGTEHTPHSLKQSVECFCHREHSYKVTHLPLQAGGAHFFAEDAGELSPEEQKEMETQSREKKRGWVDVEATYSIQSDGSLSCQWRIDASHSLPAILPPALIK